MGNTKGNVKCDGRSADDGSLYCALAYFWDHFAHDALLSEFPKPKPPVATPTELKALRKLPPHELKPSNFLRWMVVLIGDMPQPLHWLREYDYGRDIKVQLEGVNSSLLKTWEGLSRHGGGALGPGGFAKSDTLKNMYWEKSRAWQDKAPPELFRDWAREIAERVCNDVYTPLHDELQKENNTRSLTEGVWPIDSVMKRYVTIGDEYTTLAGLRLAFVLSEILEHKKHKTAHREGRGHFHRRKSWKRNFCINTIIAIIIVPLLLLGFRVHAHAGGGSFFCIARTHLKL